MRKYASSPRLRVITDPLADASATFRLVGAAVSLPAISPQFAVRRREIRSVLEFLGLAASGSI